MYKLLTFHIFSSLEDYGQTVDISHVQQFGRLWTNCQHFTCSLIWKIMDKLSTFHMFCSLDYLDKLFTFHMFSSLGRFWEKNVDISHVQQFGRFWTNCRHFTCSVVWKIMDKSLTFRMFSSLEDSRQTVILEDFKSCDLDTHVRLQGKLGSLAEAKQQFGLQISSTIIFRGVVWWPRSSGYVHWPQVWDLPKIPSCGGCRIESCTR